MSNSNPQPRIDFNRVHLVDDTAKPRRFYNLEPTTAMVEMHYGGFLVFDTRNVDVMPGPVREGWAEPWNDILLRALLHEGSVFVNAGANYGYFTVLGGRLVGDQGRVIAFEANPMIFKHLMRSLYYSGTIGRTSLFQRAVSDRDSERVRFSFDPQYSGGGAIDWSLAVNAVPARTQADCIWSERNIHELLDARGKWIVGKGLLSDFTSTTISIDTALRGEVDRVDVMLMDIEGSEPFAILGAAETIAKSPDLRIIMEWFGQYYQRPHLKKPIEEMWDLLINREGFRVFHVRPGSNPYTKPPVLEYVPDFAAFCELPHGEVYLERAEPKA